MDRMPRSLAAQVGRRRKERLAMILDDLATRGSLDVDETARRLGVSSATLRRDLAILEDQSLLHRTHGGARRVDLATELPVRYRDEHQRDAKLRIARACADTIALAPQAIAIGGGTTTTEVARQLAQRSGLTIVTNALNIGMELTMRPRLRVILTGGQVRPESYEMVGAWTERFLDGLNFVVSIMGVDGISAAGGLTTHDPVEARANLKMLERAQRVVVVADSTKIGAVTMSRIAAVGQVSLLITDRDAPAAEVAAIRAAGPEVLLV